MEFKYTLIKLTSQDEGKARGEEKRGGREKRETASTRYLTENFLGVKAEIE